MWRRRRPNPEDPPPDPDESPRAAPTDDVNRLLAELEQLRSMVASRNEPSLNALFVAAEQTALQWIDSQASVTEAHEALDAAERVEEMMRDRLGSVLALIRNTLPLPNPADAERVDHLPERSGPHAPPVVALRVVPSEREDGTSGSHSAALPPPPQPGPAPETAEQRAASRAPNGIEHDDRADAASPATPPQVPPADAGESVLSMEQDDVDRIQPSLEHAPPDEPSVSADPDPVGASSSADHDVPREGLAIFLFGRLRVALDGEPLELRLHGKALRLFGYLLAHRDRPAPKDVLMELFWPESDGDTGRRSLHQAIYTIRKAVRRRHGKRRSIIFRDDAYLLNPDLTLWCDVDEFERKAALAAEAEASGDLRGARGLYRDAQRLRTGDFLEDFLYDEWSIAERERLRLAYIRVANRLADLDEETGDLAAAMEVSQKVLAVESCDEESHRRVMRCHVAAGRRLLAIRQYRTCADQLEQTYGLAPSEATQDLYNTLIQE